MAKELLCCVCNQRYAKVYPDRMVIYATHENESHTTEFRAKRVEQIYNLVVSGVQMNLECMCGQRACATIRLQRIDIEARHKTYGWQRHINVLTLDDLSEICNYFAESNAILRSESDAPELNPLEKAS
ncbi:MAG: hypothetical protein ABR568_00725 [Pyrinomonadaceae bacterium]